MVLFMRTRLRTMAVGHLDADCFYVSAERVRDAFLCGKPVGVLGNQGACVIAKSYEMRAAGVKTGEPIWEALVKCPEGIYVKRDFHWYEVLSRKMLDVVRELSPRVEYYSIDEFFFQAVVDRGEMAPKEALLQQLAVAIRDRIWDRLAVPVTVGIARTRTLAKLISDAAKPFGALALLDRPAEEKLLADRPVTEITGIAGRRAARLSPWGITTCLDLARADRRRVRSLLTATGEALWWELNGDPVQPIHPQRPAHKVLSRGGSIGESTAEPAVLYAWLIRNLERLIEELRYHGVATSRVTVAIHYKTGHAGAGQKKLAAPCDRFDLLLEAARPCLRKAWLPGVPVTHMHLFAEELAPKGQYALDLFDPPQRRARAEAVARLKEQVNSRHGRFALRSAATLHLPAIYRDVANAYDICDVRGKICF
jgi:nucleotidyltransferase/DNA polymerase involved in DNA repair